MKGEREREGEWKRGKEKEREEGRKEFRAKGLQSERCR